MAKLIPIGPAQNLFALVDDEDFEALSTFKWNISGGYARRATAKKNGESKKTTVSMHRQLLCPQKEQLVDHKNGNKLDNRRSNLRVCTHHGNTQNRGKSKNNTSGYKGVWRNGNRWAVYIYRNGKNVYGGSFVTKKDAAIAYNKMAVEFHGEFAFLNNV